MQEISANALLRVSLTRPALQYAKDWKEKHSFAGKPKEKKTDSAKYSHNRLPICIRDSTHHYDDVKLVRAELRSHVEHGRVLSPRVSA